MDLKQYFRLNYENFLLITIFIMALGLRLWGIDFGLPYVGSYDDEVMITDNAIELLRQDNIDLSKWGIGRAQIYLQTMIGKILFLSKDVDANEVPTYAEIRSAKNVRAPAVDIPYPVPEFYWWGRASVAILGGVAVVILYFIGKSVRSSWVGLVGAFFLAANPLHAIHSHYITRTVPGLFLLLLTFYIILQAFLKQNWWFYFLSLPLIYLAIYTKQNNLILLAPLTFAVIVSLWWEFKQRPVMQVIKYVGVIGGIGIIILLTSWFWWGFNIFSFAQSIFIRIFFHSFAFGGYQFGYSGNDTYWWIIEELFIHPRASWRLVSLLAIPGIVLALMLKKKGWLLLTVLGPYLLMMSFFTVRFENWLVPVVPFLALLAALTLERVYDRLSQANILKPSLLHGLLTMIVIMIPIASIRTIVTLNYYATQPDVRQVAERWMRNKLPPNSKVVIDGWGPYLLDSQFEVVYVPFVGDEDLQSYRHQQVDYVVVNSISVLRRLVAGESEPQANEVVSTRKRNLAQIMENLPLEQKFVGPALLNPPVIEIFLYKVE